MDKIKGTEEELKFWEGFVLTKQFQTWLDDTRPTPELDKEVVSLVQKQTVRHALDVGCGVVSILRGLIPDKNLITVDLLADEYANIFDYFHHDILPPLPIAAEQFQSRLKFDVVHMRNALDHCQDPVAAFERLKNATAEQGLLIICGFENEGSHLKGLGMHQWNLSFTRPHLRVTPVGQPSSKGRLLSLIDFELELAEVKTFPSGRRWIMWAARRVH